MAEDRSGGPAFSVRLATPEDAEALTLLHLDVWDDAYTGLVPHEVLAARRRDVPDRVAQRRVSLQTDLQEGSPREPTLVAVAADGPAADAVPGGLVGFAVAGHPRDADPPAPVELMALYARAAWWGRGVGHALLARALGDRAGYLWVLDGNERGEAFYRRQGFVRDGTVEDAEEGRHVRMVRARSPGG